MAPELASSSSSGLFGVSEAKGIALVQEISRLLGKTLYGSQKERETIYDQSLVTEVVSITTQKNRSSALMVRM